MNAGDQIGRFADGDRATPERSPMVSGLRLSVPSALVGCEYSATVRDALRARGIDAWSCDLKPTDGDPTWHIQGDVREAIKSRHWDAIILHIECTKMAVCGNKHYGRGKPRHIERLEAIDWSVETVRLALENAAHVAAENPASVIFPVLRDELNADVQYIHPWQHGHPEQKKTGLALWGLPRIRETNNVHAQMMALPRKERERIFFMSPGADRGHERSRFYPGFANAMAQQWGDYLISKATEQRGGSCDSLVPARLGRVSDTPCTRPFFDPPIHHSGDLYAQAER
jgi:hypothetical protein